MTKEKQMTQHSLHCEFRQIAKPAGMVASSLTSAYWSTLSINSGNDRTPEQCTGFLEGSGYC